MKIKDEELAPFMTKRADSQTFYYDADGNITEKESPSSVAKMYVRYDELRRYYIKAGRAGQLINTVAADFNRGDSVAVKDGRVKYEYKETSEEVFENYLKFLKTKLEVYLKQAQRATL